MTIKCIKRIWYINREQVHLVAYKKNTPILTNEWLGKNSMLLNLNIIAAESKKKLKQNNG